MSCTNLKGLLEAEMPGMMIGCGHRRYLISKREALQPDAIDWDRAKLEWFDEKGDAWCEGAKYIYCNFVCPKRDTCDVKDMQFDKWMKYVNETI